MSIKIKKLGVSTISYTKKPNFKNIRYNTRENISQEEFVTLIREGYCFTHVFHANKEYGNKEKTINNFEQTNYVWFDFDDCTETESYIYQKLTYKPNIVYTTISNLKDGNLNRFRLIYILDFSIYSNDNYKYYLNLLLNTIIKDLGKNYFKYIDNNCFNVSQTMFGSNNKSIIITNDIIYNNSTFKNINDNYSIDNLLDKSKCSKKLNSNNLKKEKKILRENEVITTSIFELIRILQNTNIKTYTPVLSNEELAVLNSEQIYTNVSDQNIYKINTIYDNEGKLCRVKKGYRNNMLYNWGITTRNINPQITLEELCKNIYWLYNNRCERSEDFTLYQICTISINVFKADLNDFKELGRRKYLIDPMQKDIARKEKAKALGKARRLTRDNYILPNYDFSKSIVENAKDLGISENTVRSSLKDNNIKTTNQEKYDTFVEVYKEFPNASVRKLASLTSLSTKTIQKYKVRFKSELIEIS